MTRILIVDDQHLNRYMLETLLKGHGYETRSASNGAEAWTQAQAEAFDLIISDILMPVMDGFDLCRKMKTDGALKAIPFIFYTATYTEPKDETFALSLGAERFLVKPQPPDILLQVVRELLQSPPANSDLELPEEADFLRDHSTVLFKKLEKKISDLEREVSERKQAEAALAASERRFRTLFEQNQSPMLLVDLELERIVDANPAAAAFYGLSREELTTLNSGHLGLFAPPSALDPHEKNAFMARHRSTQGLEYIVEIHGTPIEMDGKVLTFCLLHDVTERERLLQERRRMELEIQHSQKLESLGCLAGGVAHDMNNVLAAILGLASMLQIQHEGDPGLSKSLDTILHAAERGRNLVRSLTEFSRKEMQEPQLLDLNALVQKEVSLLERTTHQKLDIQVQLEENLPRILGEPSALSSSLMNLCVNAMDAMPRGGTLRIATSILGSNQVELLVQDTGEGMPKEVLARAMEPFFTTKPAGKGTGLGLALVYAAAKAHHAQLDIQSVPGQGTTISLRFPISSKPEESPTSDPTLLSSQTGHLHILLVDDDELILESVPYMLEKDGHRVETAAGGRAALQRLDQEPCPQLVILDYNMPDINGSEVLAKIRQIHPELPVLLATGSANEAILDIIQKDPCAFSLFKPFSLAELRQKLNKGNWKKS